jgi:NADPH:quinone reductase-like Zn-dependent oxidoreductase
MTMNSLLFLTLTILSAPTSQGFSFQLPIKLPWETSTAAIQPKSPIVPNDKVVIFGGTGGVGQLVTKKLLLKDQYNVCVVARDEEKAKELLLSEDDDGSKLEVAQLNLVGDKSASDAELQKVLEGENVTLDMFSGELFVKIS